MKTTWVTALAHDVDLTQRTLGELQRYGLAPEGHFWVDDLPSLAWLEVRKKMEEQRPGLWLILTGATSLAEPNLRYGLSVLTLALMAHLETLPIAFLSPATETLAPETAPPLLANALFLSSATPAWQAKLVGLANQPAKSVRQYHLDLHGGRDVGQWFEVGSIAETWQGALFAVAGAEIDFHAVGPRGKLPERSTLSYPQKGLKLEANGVEHSGWALRNAMAPSESYFIRVRGEPSSLIFGPYPEEDANDFFVLRLK
jgi:hypothetical protein